MSRWYRAYEGTVTDAKLGEAALVAGCSRSVAIAAWHCILESCATAQRGGEYDTSPRRVAVILGETVDTITAVFDAFIELDMIGNGAVTAWKQRQFESDTSTERSRKHRQRKSNADATLQDVAATPDDSCATPPETETYTDTETECVKEAREARTHTQEPSQNEVVGDLLDNHAADLNDWEQKFLISIRWVNSLSKTQRETLKGIEGKIAPKTGKPFALPTVTRGTPAYDAWIAYYRRQSKTGKTFHETKDAFTVPSEYPPEEKAA
jgi:hypothetical protein